MLACDKIGLIYHRRKQPLADLEETRERERGDSADRITGRGRQFPVREPEITLTNSGNWMRSAERLLSEDPPFHSVNSTRRLRGRPQRPGHH